MDIISTVEVKIQKFIMDYGSDALISWLDHFDVVINSKDYPLYRSLEREACRACGISLADMRKFSNTESTNCKRIISFISFHQLKLRVPSISNLLGLSDRTVNYYIKDAENWINSPRTNKVFVEAYDKVVENFKMK